VNVRPQSIRQVGSGKDTARWLQRRPVGIAAFLGAVLLFATGPLQRADGAAVRSATANDPPAGLQLAVDKLVADGQPGVIVLTRRGTDVSHLTAGVADQATGRPMQPRDRVHIASITKTFVATVVLQLVAERRLSLQDSVQRWLPGVVVGHGYRPDRITIGELLQHTSGLRDYVDTPGWVTPQVLERTWRPRQLVAAALRLGPPLSGWNYSNTNYILAGMLIRRVTGHSPITEIRRRILLPLGLRDTSFPLTSKRIPGPHAHGYIGTHDVTDLVNPSVTWTAGAMISTVDDVARFYRALLTGKLLPPPEQRELLTTIPVHDPGELFPEQYGLGIYRVHLPCGTAWAHDGGYPGGFKTFSYTSPNGERQAVMVFNGFQMFLGKYNPLFRHDLTVATDIAFCAADA
jgi:D-alanyl-D-alanine carboxypeptidase